MKRITSIILAVLLIMSCTVMGYAVGSTNNFKATTDYQNGFFNDIGKGQTPTISTESGGTWYHDKVVQAYRYGIISGTTSNPTGNTFNPNGNLTVGEALTIAAKIHAVYTWGRDSVDAKIAEYKQPTQANWYDMYVSYCKANSLIGNEFDSSLTKTITRAEMVHAWSKILDPSEMSAQNTVTDLPDVTSATPYYALAPYNGTNSKVSGSMIKY